ncbi:hypothetical protein U0070_026425, partial [Myodes glareolus]
MPMNMLFTALSSDQFRLRPIPSGMHCNLPCRIVRCARHEKLLSFYLLEQWYNISDGLHPQGQHLVAVEEDAESEDEDEDDVKLLSVSGKGSAPGGGNKVPQKKVKPDEDDEDDDFDEKAEEKVPVKKSIRGTPAKNAQKSNQNGKDLKSSTPRSKGKKKKPKTPKGPSSVENIKAKMKASIEKGGSLPKVEAKFINYVKNCFQMIDQ